MNLKAFNAFIASSVKKKTSIDHVFKTLTFMVIIRVFLEMLLEGSHSLKFSPDFYTNIIGYLHMYLFSLSLFFTVSIPAAVYLELKYSEALTLASLFSPLILIPPIFDFISTGGRGEHLFYIFDINTFFYNYLNCFNPLVEIKFISRGIRIEILTAFLATFYVSFFVFGKRLLRSLLLTVSIYTIIIIYGYLPALYSALGMDFYSLSGEAVSGISKSQKYLFMYLLPTILISSVIGCLLYKENRENLRTIVSFLFPSRLLFYVLLLVFGYLFISWQSNVYPQVLNSEDSLKLFSALFSITLLFFYAKILNDIHDMEIDRISNRERPLVKSTLTVESAVHLNNIFIPLSFVFAIASEESFIFYWLFILSTSYVYSAPPLRLRKYYPPGHLILSAIGVSIFLAGCSLIK
ncbi:MAG: UbiA family prenyltransferase [Nitrospirota bacterium]